MKTYRGIVKGNTVILEQEPDVQEGTEAIVLIQATDEEEQEIVRRQKAARERILDGETPLQETGRTA